MAIVSRSAHRWWAPLVTIAGALLAPADASAHVMPAKGVAAVPCGVARDGSIATSEMPPVAAVRGARTTEITERGAAQFCSDPAIAAWICSSQPPPAHAASHPVAKIPDVGVAPGLRFVTHGRVRVTRLQNGSVLCCRDVPPAHMIALPSDANDDSASNGDDRADDDDSQDDQSGDDDTDLPIFDCLQLMVPYLIAPDCAPGSSSIHPSFPSFLTCQRLRC